MPTTPAASSTAAPVNLSAVKKSHVLRVGLKGRKGHWVGHLVSAEPKDQQLTIKVKWMAEPRTVSFADVVSIEACTNATGSRFAPVRLNP